MGSAWLTVFGLSLAVAWGGSGCAESVAVKRTDRVPAAKAEGKVSLDRHDNTKVTLEVWQLAKPENLTPSKELYVVWAQMRAGQMDLLGRLTVDDDGEATFHGRTPAAEFRLLVSAEDVVTPESPSDQIVFRSSYINPSAL